MATIHILADHLVSQIAAGEVVERPASVVKELVENALDAGASEIRVELESGGKRRIKVIDDGCGLEKDDTLLAFDRHATSKIANFEDLERVGTLGFRGEALASIAAVARVELLTSTGGEEGHRVRIEGGRVKVTEPAARARGTTVEIASLFFNVPARRKFLKTPQTEMRKCVEVVQGYALARPDVRFGLSHEGRTLLDALDCGSGFEALRQRIGQIFGQKLSDHLVAVAPDGGEAPEIGGFVGDKETTRGRRLFVYVNRRLIRDRAVLATFYRAVREEWKGEDYPALFLFLDIPPEEVDVNVHPQKAEVRFRDSKLTFRLSQTLRRALAEARGEEAAPLREIGGEGGAAGFASESPVYGAGPGGQPTFVWQGLGERRSPTETGAWEVREGSDSASSAGAPFGGAPSSGDLGSDGVLSGNRLATPTYSPPQRSIVPLSGRSGEPRPFRLLGQYKGTLILLEGPDGLYLIDQHVAHERILYERLRRTLARESTPSQALVTPILLDVSKSEALRLTELAPRLADSGFELVPMSGDTIALARLPAVLSSEEAERILLSLAQESGGDGIDLAQSLLDALAANLSCRNAVKMHHPLHADEMEALVAELFTAEQPYACPHGRPIVLKMTDSDLERRFGRR